MIFAVAKMQPKNYTRLDRNKNTLSNLVLGNVGLEKKDFERILLRNQSIEISPELKNRATKSYEFLRNFSKDKIIYGINTGFGPMAQYTIPLDDTQALQLNLIRSHAAGSGNIIEPLYGKSIMLARLNTLALGYSGVHPSTLEVLLQLINLNLIPCMYEHGGVGASGDLVQLAHLALCLIGEGELHTREGTEPTREVMERYGITPLSIHLREGLALMNGTSAMSGIGMVNLIRAQNLFYWAVVASAMINEIVAAFDDAISKGLNESKRHFGQRKVAAMMRSILKDSKRLRHRSNHLYSTPTNGIVTDGKVQEYYSIRCVPQILGPVLDSLNYTEKILVEEINSANDNPIVSEKLQDVFHGGNFHGDYVALEMDKLKIAITKLTMLAERQLNYLLNDKLNGILPPFVNLGKLGFNFGMQGAQFTATSTTAENQSLSFPMYLHSIPTNNDNQDIVSMGTNAAVQAQKVIDNAYEVLAIEFIALIQAVDYLKISQQLADHTRKHYFELRAIVPIFENDLPMNKRIKSVKDFLIQSSPEEVLPESN